MSDTEDPLASLSREDLIHLLKRDQFVKEQLGARIGALWKENTELLAVVQELQAERQAVEVPHPEVPTDVTS